MLINGTMSLIPSWRQLSPFGTVPRRVPEFVLCVGSLLLFIAEQSSTGWTYQGLLSQAPGERHLG